MTGLRDALEAAYWEHWRKALRDNPRDGLPAYLDRLEEIIRGCVPDGIVRFDAGTSGPVPDEEAAAFAERWLRESSGKPPVVLPPDPRPSDDEIAAWVEAHPDEFAAWQRRQNRINGAPPPFEKPAPQARRRTTRKAGGT